MWQGGQAVDWRWRETRRAIAVVKALMVIVCAAVVGVPVAGAEEAPWTQTFSVIYWPTTLTGELTVTGPLGNKSVTQSTNALSQPFLIFDYRVVSPSSVGVHLYYSPLMGTSNFADSSVSGNGGLWGGEVTYNWVIPIKPPAVLILNPYAGYGQQNFNQSTTGLLGNPINFSETTGGFYFGLNAILPLSPQFFVSAGVSWYPWGFANLSLSAPVQGLSTSISTSAPQTTESIAITYSTADHWNFTLGYQWGQVSLSAFTLPNTTGGGQTLGASLCPCNIQLSGFVLSAGKTF